MGFRATPEASLSGLADVDTSGADFNDLLSYYTSQGLRTALERAPATGPLFAWDFDALPVEAYFGSAAYDLATLAGAPALADATGDPPGNSVNVGGGAVLGHADVVGLEATDLSGDFTFVVALSVPGSNGGPTTLWRKRTEPFPYTGVALQVSNKGDPPFGGKGQLEVLYGDGVDAAIYNSGDFTLSGLGFVLAHIVKSGAILQMYVGGDPKGDAHDVTVLSPGSPSNTEAVDVGAVDGLPIALDHFAFYPFAFTAQDIADTTAAYGTGLIAEWRPRPEGVPFS